MNQFIKIVRRDPKTKQERVERFINLDHIVTIEPLRGAGARYDACKILFANNTYYDVMIPPSLINDALCGDVQVYTIVYDIEV